MANGVLYRLSQVDYFGLCLNQLILVCQKGSDFEQVWTLLFIHSVT